MPQQPRHSPVRLSADITYLYHAEIAGLGLDGERGIGALATADLNRFRRLARAAVPDMTERQWGLVSHVLDGWEFNAMMHRRGDDLPGPNEIAAEIMDWMRGGGSETEPEWARELYDGARKWKPLVIAGILLRLREEAARKSEDAQ